MLLVPPLSDFVSFLLVNPFVLNETSEIAWSRRHDAIIDQDKIRTRCYGELNQAQETDIVYCPLFFTGPLLLT